MAKSKKEEVDAPSSEPIKQGRRLAKKAIEEPPKRERGRPKKTSVAKGEYQFVLFKSTPYKEVKAEDSPALTNEQQAQRLALNLDKIREIVQEEAASEYYWRLVFTATFHLYRSRKQMEAMAAGNTKPPHILPSDMAEEAGMEYFNLKNLFSGRGTAKNVFCFLRFLHGRSIDFNQVQYNESIIDRAYTFLTVLRQDGMNPEEVKRLFYK